MDEYTFFEQTSINKLLKTIKNVLFKINLMTRTKTKGMYDQIQRVHERLRNKRKLLCTRGVNKTQ